MTPTGTKKNGEGEGIIQEKNFFDWSGNQIISDMKSSKFITTLHNIHHTDLNINLTNDILFKGKDVANALGYKRGRDAIQRHVDITDKIRLGKLSQNDDAISNGTSKKLFETIYITEDGMLSLAFKSKLPGAKSFKKWAFKIIRDKMNGFEEEKSNQVAKIDPNNDLIRRKLELELDLYKQDKLLDLQLKHLSIKKCTVDTLTSVYDKIGYEDADKLLLRDYNKNIILSNGISEKVIEIPISQRVTDLYPNLNMSYLDKRELWKRIGSAAAGRYRLLYNKEPRKKTAFIGGQPIKINHYIEKDYVNFLDLVIKETVEPMIRLAIDN